MTAEVPTSPESESHPEYLPVRRALISVFDKTGVVEFAEGIHDQGVEIISTGGTAAKLEAAGIPVTPVEAVTGFPEMLDGRVKTLDPHLFAGILADRTKVEHLDTLVEHDLKAIDLICVNLYPFEKTVANTNDPAEIIEKIDIGGPSMIRAGAKNYDSVVTVCSPDMYPQVLQEIQTHGGTSELTRGLNAVVVFELMARYDSAIYRWLDDHVAENI